jgi:hypothetical protein
MNLHPTVSQSSDDTIKRVMTQPYQDRTTMLNAIRFVANEGARGASMIVIVLCVLLTGCAGGVTQTAQYSAQPQVRPDTIYVYSFDSTPDQVKLDNGGMIQKVASQFSGASAAQKQTQEAFEVREQVADDIVQQLQSMGLHAIRADAPAPANQNVLIVQGKFDTIDSGNRRRRILIGLGAGKSELSTSVQLLYKPAGGTPRLVQSFDASADSGKMPGIAETAGVGAAAGHLATSAAAGAGLHGVSETTHGGAAGNAKKLAESIAKQVAEIGKSQGWMPTERTKG